MGIFHRVLQRFSHQKLTEEPSQSADRLLAQINRYATLIRLQDERQLVEIMIGEHAESFQSMIVGVDLYNQKLIIDELSPRIQNPESLIGQSLVLRHQNQQQMLKITTEIVEWDQGSQCLLLNLPEHVNYQPRRQQTRFILDKGNPINAHIDPIYGAPWHAGVDNISLGGARILVMGDLRPHLHKHKPLRKCVIHLDNGQQVSCRGRVKAFSYYARPFRRTEISIEFESMANEDLFKLEEFIEQLLTT